MRAWTLLVMTTLSCAGAVESGDGEADAGASDAATDAATAPAQSSGCGYTFDEGVAAFAPERVCQTTEYRLDAGYCTHWVACSSL